jgi:hypothetical protein
MARAGWRQAEVVLDNILANIQGRTSTHKYEPNVFVEGAIKLTLGKKHQVIYAMDYDGSDIMIPSRDGKLDLEIESAWKQHGADFKRASEAITEREGEAAAAV